MTALVREYRKEDEDRARMIWSVAFRGGAPYPPERTIPLADEETFVAIANDRVAGAYRILSTTGHLPGTALQLRRYKRGCRCPGGSETPRGTRNDDACRATHARNRSAYHQSARRT